MDVSLIIFFGRAANFNAVTACDSGVYSTPYAKSNRICTSPAQHAFPWRTFSGQAGVQLERTAITAAVICERLSAELAKFVCFFSIVVNSIWRAFLNR